MGILKSKWFLAGIGILLALGLVLTIYKSCNLSNEYKLVTGEFKAYKRMAENNTKTAQKTIDNQTKIIGDMTKKIAEHESETAKKNEQIKDANKKSATVESQFADLKTDAERVVNLTNQVNIWKEKFSLAERIIKDKDGIIFSLATKYEAQVKITEAVQVQLTDCMKLQPLYDDRISILESALKKARLVSKLKSWGGVALAAVIVYTLVKK